MQQRTYYLALSNVVLKSNYTAIKFIEDQSAEMVTIEDDLDKSLTKVTVPDITNVRCSDVAPLIIKKTFTEDEDKLDIEEGVYHLYRDVSLNGFHMVVSDETIDVAINQYVVKNPPIYPSIRKEKDNVLIKFNSKLHNRDYVEMINESGLFYIIHVEKDAYLASIYGVVLNRTNKTTLKSHDIIDLSGDHLLIEEADYVAALIKKLEYLYPQVQFYNVDSDTDDSSYSEFFKYRAQMGDFTSDLITTPVFNDPIYGSVMTTTLQIEFEYHTADLVKFSKRRFDYQINRFLSGVTTCDLKFPNTDRKMSFTVHWDRAATAPGSDDLTTGTTMNEANKTQYKFSSTIKLVVTIYRLAMDYPVIKKIILGTPIFMDKDLVYDGTGSQFVQVDKGAY
ncbi:MAG: hypothetical protein MJZ34_02870 [Paludibacteraceae bacterium]|nr:hypothetical protein [Paludibacteraceae bacterium]